MRRQTLRGSRATAWALMVVLAGCGGGGSGPSSPTPTAPPAAVVNDMTTVGSPTPGSTVAATACVASSGACASVTVTVTTTFNANVTGGQVYVQLLDGSGRQCGSALSATVSLTAGTPTPVAVSTFLMECSFPFTTTTVRATLFPANPSGLPVSQRQGLYAESFNGGWTFTAGAGATPTPTPRPTATPAPTPSDGFPVCSGSRPAASCGQATGQCNNGDYTCSQNRTGTCSGNGGLRCVFCPGPIC